MKIFAQHNLYVYIKCTFVRIPKINSFRQITNISLLVCLFAFVCMWAVRPISKNFPSDATSNANSLSVTCFILRRCSSCLDSRRNKMLLLYVVRCASCCYYLHTLIKLKSRLFFYCWCVFLCWILFFRLNFNLLEWILLSMVCGSIEVHLQQGTLLKDFFFIWILSKFVKPSKPKLSDAIILTGQKLVYIKRLSIEINFWLLQVNSGILYGWRQNSA